LVIFTALFIEEALEILEILDFTLLEAVLEVFLATLFGELFGLEAFLVVPLAGRPRFFEPTAELFLDELGLLVVPLAGRPRFFEPTAELFLETELVVFLVVVFLVVDFLAAVFVFLGEEILIDFLVPVTLRMLPIRSAFFPVTRRSGLSFFNFLTMSLISSKDIPFNFSKSYLGAILIDGNIFFIYFL